MSDVEDILLSPSGDPIGQIGPGARIRMAEGQRDGSQTIAVAVAELLPDGLGVGLRVSLTKPKANRKYRVECEFDCGGNATGNSITTQLQVSYDNAATWVNLDTPDPAIDASSSEPLVHVHPRFVLQTLPSFPAVAPASAIFRANVNGTAATGNILRARMSVEECKA